MTHVPPRDWQLALCPGWRFTLLTHCDKTYVYDVSVPSHLALHHTYGRHVGVCRVQQNRCVDVTACRLQPLERRNQLMVDNG